MLRPCAELLLLLLDGAGNPDQGQVTLARARPFHWHQSPFTLLSLSLLPSTHSAGDKPQCLCCGPPQ